MARGDAPRPSKKEAAEWEAKLAAAGMPAELGVDKAAQAQRRAQWAERGIDEVAVMDAMRMYWVYAAAASHGEHKKAMQEIADRLGLREHDLDETLMKSVEEEVAAADRAAQKLAARRLPKAKMFAEMRKEFPDFSDEVIDGVMMKQAA